MRFFEIMLILLLILSLTMPLLMRRVERWVLLLVAAAVAALMLHLFIEKYRWQMVPLYLLVMILAVSALLGPAAAPRLGRWRAAACIAGLILVVPSALLPFLFPVPSVPSPTGDYHVGTFSTMLVDASRKELYSANPDEPRALMAQLWYPTQAVQGLQLAPWVDNPAVVAPSISRWLDFPAFFLDHVSLAKSHSFLDAPLADSSEPFPVVTFSHGWNGIRQQSTYLMEELASHGYVVISIEHTYGARVVVFPDGRVAENNPSALPYDGPPETLEPAADLLGDQWADDIGFVLDTLFQWNETDPRFAGRLDLSRVAVSGHSTGGGAAVEFCGRDPRCKILLGLDAYLTPVSDPVLANGLDKPALLLFSESWPSDKNNALLTDLLANSPQAQEASVLGTAHYDFSDLPLLSPLAPMLGLKGPLKAQTALAINRAASLAMLDAVLRDGSPAAVRELAAQYPELRFDYLP